MILKLTKNMVIRPQEPSMTHVKDSTSISIKFPIITGLKIGNNLTEFENL